MSSDFASSSLLSGDSIPGYEIAKEVPRGAQAVYPYVEAIKRRVYSAGESKDESQLFPA